MINCFICWTLSLYFGCAVDAAVAKYPLKLFIYGLNFDPIFFSKHILISVEGQQPPAISISSVLILPVARLRRRRVKMFTSA